MTPKTKTTLASQPKRKEPTAKTRLENSQVSKSMLAELIQSAAEGIIITDTSQPDRPIIYSNQGFCNITGYSMEEIIGNNCRFLQGAETDPQTIKSLSAAIKQSKPFEGEILNYKKDGTPFWNYLRMYPITDRSGQMTHMVGFQSDITARKKMGELLKQSEQRFMTIFQSSPIAIGLVSIATGNILDLNEACAAMLGYERVELMGKPVRHFEFAASPERFDALFAELQGGTPIKNSERRFRRKSGEIGTALLSSEVVEVDNQPCALLILNDITERKQRENELRRAQSLLAQTNRVANIGGWELDIETGELFWSEITKRIHEADEDYKPKVQTALDFYMEGESRTRISEAVDRAMRDATPYDLEVELTTKKGRHIWVRTLGEVELRDGKPVRLYGSFQDITDRKKIEIQLNEQLNELMRWSEITTGREMRVLELKSEVNKLLEEMGRPPRYSIAMNTEQK